MKQQRYSDRDNSNSRDNSNDSFSSGRPGSIEDRNSDPMDRSARSYGQRDHQPRTAGGQDWYRQDPMDERSGYRSEERSDRSSSYDYNNDDNRSYNDRQFDRFSQRSPASLGTGQSYSYNQRPDYGSSSHSAENYGSSHYGPRSGSMNADRAGSERYNQQSDYGTSYGYGGREDHRSQDRSYDYGAGQNNSFRPYTPRGEGSSRTSYGSYDLGSNRMDRGYDSSRGSQQYGRDRGNSYDYDRFAQSSQQEPYTDQWQAYGTMDRSSSTSEGGRDRSRYSGRGPRSFKRSDERIQDEVCEMLTRNGEIDADEIDVQVRDGEVTLTGTVPERRMKHLAEDCVERSFGVREVTNNLRVKKASERTSSSSQNSTLNADSTDTSSTSSQKSAGTTGKKSSSGVGSSSTSSSDDKPANH